MTYSLRVIAVDPGPIPGVVMLTAGAEPPQAALPIETGQSCCASIFQCNADSLLWLVRELLTTGPDDTRRVLAVERFIVGMRSARLSNPRAAAVTRDMIGAVVALGRDLPGVAVVQRSASEVMPWASDSRLKAAGLLDTTKGMPHARAAARHALFAAVRDCGLNDPLSKVRAP